MAVALNGCSVPESCATATLRVLSEVTGGADSVGAVVAGDTSVFSPPFAGDGVELSVDGATVAAGGGVFSFDFDPLHDTIPRIIISASSTTMAFLVFIYHSS